MKKLIWRIQALYWFWRLAGFISWEAAGELWDSYADFGEEYVKDSPKSAVREELSYWGE